MLMQSISFDLPNSGKRLRIMQGFTTDGASIPRVFWSLIGVAPFDADVVAPALAHDALYAAELLSRDACDGEFEELMDVNSERSHEFDEVFYRAVRLGGYEFAWKNHTPASIAEARTFCSLV